MHIYILMFMPLNDSQKEDDAPGKAGETISYKSMNRSIGTEARILYIQQHTWSLTTAAMLGLTGAVLIDLSHDSINRFPLLTVLLTAIMITLRQILRNIFHASLDKNERYAMQFPKEFAEALCREKVKMTNEKLMVGKEEVIAKIFDGMSQEYVQ